MTPSYSSNAHPVRRRLRDARFDEARCARVDVDPNLPSSNASVRVIPWNPALADE